MGRAARALRRGVHALLLLLSSVTSLAIAGPTVSTPKWSDEGTLGLGGNWLNCVGSGVVCTFNAVTGKLDITVSASVAGEANSLSNNGTDCAVGSAPRGIDTVGNATGCFAVHPLMAESAACAGNGYVTNWNIDGTITCSVPTAAQVLNTPGGTIAATDVGAALTEIAQEAQPLDADLTTLAGKTIAGNGTNVRLSTGAFTTNDCVKVDGSGNLASAGSACGTGGGGGGGSQGLQDVVTIQRRVTDAVALDSCVAFGGLNHYVCMYGNASEGAVLAVSPAQDLTWTLAATKDFFFKAADGSTIMALDNDTESMSLLNPLALTSGGTGQATAQLAINTLTGVASATNEQCLRKDTATGNATYKDCLMGIVAPATTTDNAVAVYNGTAGTLLKNSLVVIDPSTGNITTPGTVSAGAGGSGGGGWVFTEGTAPTAPAVNTIQVYAPVDVTTAYGIALPAASATGFLLGTNVSNVNTLSFVGFSGSGSVLRQTNPIFDTYADMTEATAPATPSAGVQRLYAKTGGAICGKNSAGTETCMGSGGGGTPGGSTTQLQYNNAGAFGGISGATTNGTVLTTVNQVLTTPTVAKISNLTTNGYVKTTGSDGTLSVVTAPTLTVTRPMKMSTISVSNANAFVDTIDGTNFDYSALRFVDAVTGDTFWTYKIPPELAATPAWNVIVTSKAVSGAGGNVVLNLNCKDFATNVAFDAALTALQAATTHAISTSANTTITTLSGTNYDATVPLTAGDFLVCQLTRLGGSTSPSDSLNVDWLVLDVSIRLNVNVGT